MIEDWKPRQRHRRMPYGYMADPNDATKAVPDFTVLVHLEATFDQLDAGISLREAADYLASKTDPLSHVALRRMWDEKRPNHPLKQPRVKKKRNTVAERSKKILKQKLANEKRTLAAVTKRIEKKKEELGQTKRLEELPYAEIPVEYDYTELPEDADPFFKPNPGPQTAFLAAWEQEVLYGGAAGGGKSYALLADPMRYFDSPHFNGIIIRRTMDELRELIRHSKVLYKQYSPKAHFSEKKSSWIFPSGATLWMSYLERDQDADRYQGQAFTWVGFDELTHWPTPYAWNLLRSRLRAAGDYCSPTTGEPYPLAQRATTNPGGIGHGWVKRMFIDPAPWNSTFAATDIDTGEPLVYPAHHEKAGQPLFYRRFIPARLADNPYLYDDGQYEANLLSLPESQRRQLLEGDWDHADGAAFSEFRRSLHTCEPFEIDNHWMKFRSCDFGYSTRQASAVHWYAVDPAYGTLYVYRELYVNQLTGTELQRKINELERGETIAYGVLDSSVWSIRGQTGPTIAEEMQKLGGRWRQSDRSAGSRIASKNRLHELLRVDPINGKPGIIFFNTCRQIISDLPVIPQSREDDDIDKKYASDHAYDSIRYGIQTRPQALSLWGQSPPREYIPADRIFGY